MLELEKTTEQSGITFAATVFEVYDNEIDRLIQMEDTLFLLAEILDGVELIRVLDLLQDALSLPPCKVCRDAENYVVCFLCGFENELIRIGFNLADYVSRR